MYVFIYLIERPQFFCAPRMMSIKTLQIEAFFSPKTKKEEKQSNETKQTKDINNTIYGVMQNFVLLSDGSYSFVIGLVYFQVCAGQVFYCIFFFIFSFRKRHTFPFFSLSVSGICAVCDWFSFVPLHFCTYLFHCRPRVVPFTSEL